MEFETIIEKLSKINLANLSEDRNGLISECGKWYVCYIVALDQRRKSDNRFFITVHLRYNDAHVMSYGCSLSEQNIFGLWLLKQKYVIQEKIYNEKHLNSQIGKKLFY